MDRACWFKKDGVHGKWEAGTLRAWSTDHEEYESGPGHFPVGIIEDAKTGMCHSVYVKCICFASVPPS